MPRTLLARPGPSHTSPRTNSVRPPMRSRPHVPPHPKARARPQGDSSANGSVTSSRRPFASSCLTTSVCGTTSAGQHLTAEREWGSAPSERPDSAGYFGSELGFCRAGRVAFWLLQGERDRGADELEGLPLGAGRLGEHRDGGRGCRRSGPGCGSRWPGARAGRGSCGRGCPAGSYWQEALAWACRRAAGRGDGVGRGGRVLVGEGQRRPGPAQVPGQVAGEHADQHVGPDAFFQPVEDRPQVQVVGFDVPEVPLDVFEVLVGGRPRRARRVRWRGRGCAARRTRPGRLRRRSGPAGARRPGWCR